MKGSLKVFTFADIPVFIHWTFWLLGIFLAYYGWSAELDSSEFLVFIFLFLALFGCVVFHEYGHALMARYFGVKTRDIILLPLGGMARLERLPHKPMQEFLVAAAGPVVNLLLALIFGIILFFDNESDFLVRIFTRRGALILVWDKVITILFLLNISLVVMNLLPAFPLDGGRMFRALLAIKLERLRATRIASWVGQAFATVLVGYGLYAKDLMSILVGFFIFTMAKRELQSIRTETILSTHPIRKAVKNIPPPDFKEVVSSIAGDLTIWEGLEKLRSTSQDYLLVKDGDDYLGILDYESINQFLKTKTD